jgi:hypothetical protein
MLTICLRRNLMETAQTEDALVLQPHASRVGLRHPLRGIPVSTSNTPDRITTMRRAVAPCHPVSAPSGTSTKLTFGETNPLEIRRRIPESSLLIKGISNSVNRDSPSFVATFRITFILPPTSLELGDTTFPWCSRYCPVIVHAMKGPVSPISSFGMPPSPLTSPMGGGHRGRTASYLTAPAQIPACGFLAPGSSGRLAAASRLRSRGLPVSSWVVQRSVVGQL